jgi:hypothetical protein
MFNILSRLFAVIVVVLFIASPAFPAWTINDIADKQAPVSSIVCSGTGPAASSEYLDQWKYNFGEEKWESFGYTKMTSTSEPGVITTGPMMGTWMTTAYPTGTSYPVGDYKLTITDETGPDPAEPFDVL